MLRLVYRFDVYNRVERLTMRVAFSLPRKLAYWCAIRVGANATQGQYGNQDVPDLRFMEALGRW